jgi:hypothetical protein
MAAGLRRTSVVAVAFSYRQSQMILVGIKCTFSRRDGDSGVLTSLERDVFGRNRVQLHGGGAKQKRTRRFFPHDFAVVLVVSSIVSSLSHTSTNMSAEPDGVAARGCPHQSDGAGSYRRSWHERPPAPAAAPAQQVARVQDQGRSGQDEVRRLGAWTKNTRSLQIHRTETFRCILSLLLQKLLKPADLMLPINISTPTAKPTAAC